MKTLIAPSILSADFAKLGQEVAAIESAGADLVHVDVMDGSFVPNITIGPCVVSSIKPHTKLPLDVHLMIDNPDFFAPQFAEAGADFITIHAESVIHLDRSLQLLQNLGVKVGLSLVPSCHENILQYVIDRLDLILVMTVNPGFGGQKFLSSQLKKIENIRKMIAATGKDIHLQVDGGINAETAKLAISAGADVLVAGSAVFSGGNYAENIRKLRP